MGGKNKQRTKGNVRPSSSGRAAELLAREGGVVPGFVGFGVSTSNDPGYVPAVHGAEDIDSLVDADFRLVLRKLSKRDVVTKLKAVQEFGAMCQEREPDVVKGVLPYWPRIYCKISVDHDRRVREATQQAFEQLILKVKRNLAPYLKSIMGHWLIAQCDTYTPASSAASVAFQAAFPLNKQPEALSFCKDEVLSVLQENLLKETADTLSDPQNVPEEEREAKYMRLLTSSLLALKRLLTHLSQADRDALGERLTQLLAQGKFWKYSKHKTPQVRGAFFEVVACLCELVPQLVQTESPRVCSSVLLSIDDTDPVVLPALWAAVLHVVSGITDCWSHVNARKGVLPKLWALLKEGGKGLATALHPNLLPFISKLPEEITTPALDFYTILFTNIILGLSSERAMSSPSESAAIIVATVECLRYCLVQHAGEDQEQKSVQSMVIADQLLPLMDRALETTSLQTGPLFPLAADMLLSWEKRAAPACTTDDPPAGTEATFQRALLDYWEGLGRLCLRHVDSEEPDRNTLEGIAALLRVTQNPESGSWRQGKRKKKSVKISFSSLDAREPGEGGEVGEEGVPQEARAQESQPKETAAGQESSGSPPQRTSGHLVELVCQLAEVNMVHVTERGSERHLHFLSMLLGAFPTRQVFQVLLQPDETAGKEAEGKDLGLGDAELARNPAVRFLLLRVVDWLRQEGRKDTDFLVDMVFSALHCCSSREEKTRILNHITTMNLEWGVILQIIQKASADAVCIEEYRGWLKGSVLGECLVGLAAVLCARGLRGSSSSSSSSHTHSWALISLVLSHQHNNETLIGKEYVEKIIDKLHATLSEAKGMSDAGNMEPLVSFISDVAANFFSSVKGCLLLASAEELLLTVFQLCAQDQSITCLSDTLLQKLKHACFAGVGSLVNLQESKVVEGSFLQSVALWVKTQLISSSLGVKSLQVLVQAVQSLVQRLCSVQQSGRQLLSQFIHCLSLSEEEWRKTRQALPPQWVKSPLLSGRLRASCAYPCMDAWKFRTSARLPAHLCASALLGQVICTAAEATSGQGDAQDPASALELPPLKHTVAEILYAFQWCSEMEYSPSVVSDFHKMLQEWDLITRVHKISPHLLQTLFTRSLTEGSLWALTLCSYIQTGDVTPADIQSLYGNVESFFPLTEKSVNTLQVLCPSLSRDERESLTALSIAELLNWQDGNHNVSASIAVLHCCLGADTPVENEVLQAALATMMEWRNSKEDWFLFSSDLGKVSAEDLSLTVEMMRFLSWQMSHSPTILREAQWDFLLCSVLAWLETASENTAVFWNPWVQLFVCETCELIVRLTAFLTAPPSGVVEQLPPELCTEWQEFFSEGINSLLLPLLVKIPEVFREPDDPLFPLAAVRAVGEALTHIPVQQLLENKLPARLVAGQRSNLPDVQQTLLNTLTPLLLFKARPLQLSVYHMLNKVMPQLPESDTESDNSKSEEDDGEEPSLSPPAALMSILTATEELLENILAGVQVGEFAVVQPLSVEHCCILGYLLAWKLLLTFFKASPSNLRVQYSQYLKKSRSLHQLLLHLFRLMPENPVLPGQGTEASSKEYKTFFTEPISLSVSKVDSMQWEVPHLACSVYYGALKDLPAMVRLWWNSQEKRVVSTVDRFTSRYVSSVLSAQEIASVHASTQTFDSMTVKARTTTREVIATYSVDDIFIELVIQLPQNYPLGSISVESGRRVGVAVQQWRNWMLQLSTYLTHQNGSIMEGLALWKNNVDKRFEGVEDCMICFSVIHGSNYSLPKKACRTCKKKFHSACLYKWFTSSNKSTCPLCRETFF
ncbi:E3 ubiquitin-protein ligase listerin [Alosa sapidissima]|uniref:E3 ubiquitin-protein ligase listerin n=1 Tax=Alosa sapidissima TaxID=34773 RepID=UPI001C08BD90|nr:E3 ubiquitin-protein ligase listerin [Alosa sapidissima]